MTDHSIQTDDGLAVDDLLDVPSEYREIVRRYGRGMFKLVMDAGMCGQAMQTLGRFAQSAQSRGMLVAMTTIAQAYNELSSAYAKDHGWTEADLAQCDRDIQLAFAGKLVVPGSSIILHS